MSDKEREEMEVEQKKVSLFTCIEKWLESWPELDEKNFNFPAKFEQAILASIKPDEDKQKVEKVAMTTCVCYCTTFIHINFLIVLLIDGHVYTSYMHSIGQLHC